MGHSFGSFVVCPYATRHARSARWVQFHEPELIVEAVRDMVELRGVNTEEPVSRDRARHPFG